VNRNTVVGFVVGAVVGGTFVGLLAYQAGRAGGHISQPAPGGGAFAPQGMQGGTPGAMPGGMPGSQPAPQQGRQVSVEAMQAIPSLEKMVAQQPQNHAAWVQLGNMYFDTNQRQKAIEAYGRALELKPNDPNVITDQGVMYEELKQPDKALENFKRAHAIDPTHIDSLYNQGVAYMDKQDAAKAKEIWNQVVEKAPQSPQAGRARAILAEMASQGH
jgi:cytochrome c-type biogenesis protein CcmH/NrfG